MSKLSEQLNKFGKLPNVQIVVKPLDRNRKQLIFKSFVEYSFSSSILVPVDTFHFKVVNPTDSSFSFSQYIQEGDVVVLQASTGGPNEPLATGIIDTVDYETNTDGEWISMIGRTTLGQLEDQDMVTIASDPIWSNKISLLAGIQKICQNTKIQRILTQNAGEWNDLLLASEPSESKMSALLRFIEPLNLLVWNTPTGALKVGKPNQSQQGKKSGTIIMDKKNRKSNVYNMKATYNSTKIPNLIVPVWSGQENVQNRISKEQIIRNPSRGPSRLFRRNYVVQKTIVVSTPSGSDPVSLSEINLLKIAGSNLLQAYALRAIAKSNIEELIVRCQVHGHYNDSMEFFQADQQYRVIYPGANIDEAMYLYEVEYTMDKDSGPRTRMSFCRLGRIVANVPIEKFKTEVSSIISKQNGGTA